MTLDPRVGLTLAHDRQRRERELATLRRRQYDPARSWRGQVGRTLIRVGRWLTADAPSTPAWSS